MTAFFLKLRAVLLTLSLGVIAIRTDAGWSEKSAGFPLIEHASSHEIGPGESKTEVLEDRLGRLFVGGAGLHVFDGQTWRTFPAGDSLTLRIAFGEDGRIWAAGNNEAGYFEEVSLGVFRYHSLISQLPANERLLGYPWGCAPVGRLVYFFFRHSILRWDGSSAQLQLFAGESRLFPFSFEGAYWFHHVDTGLYRLTESGFRLQIPATDLPPTGVLGLARDSEGLLVASGMGLYRPGNPPRPISEDLLNTYVADHRLAAITPLPDGSYAINTMNGGMVLADRAGRVLRILDEDNGLPSSVLSSMRADGAGGVWSGSANGIFTFEGAGRATIFDSYSGIKGKVNRLLTFHDGRLLAATMKGISELDSALFRGARFHPLPSPSVSYYLLQISEGLMLLRHGGIDVLTGGAAPRTVVTLTGAGAYLGAPSRTEPGAFFIFESSGLFRLRRNADGAYDHALLEAFSEVAGTMHEDARGRIWIGTGSRGAWLFDTSTSKFSQLMHPDTGRPFSGLTTILPRSEEILVFAKDIVLRAEADGTGLKSVSGAPKLEPLVALEIPGLAKSILVAFKRKSRTTKSTEGLGIMAFGKDGQVEWRELDVPEFSAVGSVNTMVFTQEEGRRILWVGGDKILRLDFDAIGPVTKPTTPVIQLDLLNSGRVPDRSGFTFSFKDHRLGFHVFTGSYTRSKDWFVQTRLGNGDWSAPDARRSYEFTNLSEGDYRFEARTINAAGLTSEPAGFVFNILPPWYRSRWAYAGYGVILLLGVVGFIRVRERRIQARNQELESLVNVRTAELVKANAAKDEFLAGISHEIRNPMNGVIGIAENFRTDGLDPENRRKFSLLRQCASHLSSLLEDILDFSKVQAGAIELDPKPFDLPELVESVAGITRSDSEKYGIPVEVAVSPAVPRKLVGDARRIRQILINFVSNALKFSGKGEVSVTVWCKPAEPGHTEVVFAISDEGPGISAEEQARLFTRFERGAAAQKGRVPGTGLGLALCKGLAEKMGGRIWLESELGRGSCFYFSAPFRVIETPAEITAPATAPVAALARTALVVDDQEYNRIVLADLLQSMGFKVHATQEGQAALDAAARQAFDVVFLDFNLPGLSGVDVARALRSSGGPSAHALILATTAFTTPEKRAQCLDAGMDAFLGKPVTRERLAKAVAGLVPVASAPEPAPAVAPTSQKTAGPSDRLVNLRLLARKKSVPLAQELALYFSEMEAELAHLDAAIQAGDVTEAARVSHMLCGRCSFIFERDLEQAQRQIEAAVGAARWAEARTHRSEFDRQLASVRVRLASSDPVAPPA